MISQIEFYKQKLAYEMDPADLFVALEERKDVVVIDARQVFGYEKEHIPSAINFPHREMNAESTKDLDKSKTYICYCDGIGCNGSTKASLKMTELGFKVKELIGGLQWWKLDGFATEGNEASAGQPVQCAC